MGAKCNVFCSINEPKFDRVMTFSPHKGMDLAKICITKMVYCGKEKLGITEKFVKRLSGFLFFLSTVGRVSSRFVILFLLSKYTQAP